MERNIVRSCIWKGDSPNDSDGYEDDEANDLKTYHVSAKNFKFLAKAIARKKQLQQGKRLLYIMARHYCIVHVVCMKTHLLIYDASGILCCHQL